MENSHTSDDNRCLVMSEIMTPDKVNFNGSVHGGYILSLLDRVAYACGSRYAGKITVTLSVDQVVFKQPIYVGELVVCYSNVNFVGNTSMEIGIRVVAENLLTRVSRHTNTCFFTMVAMSPDGKPSSVPPLTLHNDIQKRRFAEGKERRDLRLAASTRKKT